MFLLHLEAAVALLDARQLRITIKDAKDIRCAAWSFMVTKNAIFPILLLSSGTSVYVFNVDAGSEIGFIMGHGGVRCASNI